VASHQGLWYGFATQWFHPGRSFFILLLSAIGLLTLRFKRNIKSFGTLVSRMIVFLGPGHGSVARVFLEMEGHVILRIGML
jgi:hypothetical protein